MADPASSPLRLTPLADADWPMTATHLREGFAGRLNIYRVMAHRPELLTAWETLRNHVVLANALPASSLEHVILRTGFRWGSRYEWAHHVARGRAAGLDDDMIARAAAPPPDIKPRTADERLLVAVDQLLDTGRLEEELGVMLVRDFGVAGVLDLLATVGMYTTLAFIANSFDPPIDADVPPVPLPRFARDDPRSHRTQPQSPAP